MQRKEVSAMKQDHRTCPRVEVKLPVYYKYFEDGEVYHALKGEVKNLSAKGMAMLNDRALENGQKLLTTIFLSPERSGFEFCRRSQTNEQEGLPIVILSRAEWCRDQGGGRYAVGVSFLVPDRHHQLRFNQFLNDLDIYRAIRYEEMPESDENEP